VKVRIGISLGAAGEPGGFAAAVDLLESAGIDSLWLPEAAAEAGREVDPDHFGISLPVAFDGGVPAALAESIAWRRPDVAPESLVADGWDGARRLISEYVAAGLSKFVVRNASAFGSPGSPGSFIAEFARELIPLQTRVALPGGASAGT
jgi:hypothetical protein